MDRAGKFFLVWPITGNSTRQGIWNSLAVVFGIVLGGIALLAENLRLYQIIMIMAAGSMLILMLVTHRPRQILLAILLLMIPINVFSIVPFSQSLPYNPSGAPPVLQFRLFDFPLIALFALTAIENLAQKRSFRLYAIDFAVFAMLVWGIVSIYNALRPEFSVSELLRIFKLYILARLVSANIQDESDLRIAATILLAGAMMQGLIGLTQYLTNNDFGLGIFTVGDLRRITGTLGWPNTLGAYAAVTFLISLILWLGSEGTKWTWIACVASFVLLILSYSRGAWTATWVGLALACILFWKGHLLNFGVFLRAVGLIFGTGIILMVFYNSIIARAGNVTEDINTVATRMDLNQIAINMMIAHPLAGVGLNNYMQVISEYDRTGISITVHEPVHNVFLLIGAETGLIGLALFILLIGLVLLACWRVLNRSNHFLRIHAIGLSCAITALAISNIADVHLKTDGLFAFFWFLIGLVLAIHKLSEEQTHNNNDLAAKIEAKSGNEAMSSE